MIRGKDFMIYFEYDTGNGIINLPYCSATTVTLSTTNEPQEVTKPSDSKWKYYQYGLLSYTLQIDGLVKYSLQDVQDILLSTINGLVLDNQGRNIVVGENNIAPDDIGYYDLETKLLNWLPVKWMMRDTVDDFITYSGECLITQNSLVIATDDFIKGSIQMQGQGAYQRLTLPVPANMQYLGATDAATETADITESGSTDREVGQTWIQRFVISGLYLPGGVFNLEIYSQSLTHACKPGDTITEILTDLSQQVNNEQFVPANPPPAVVSATADDGLKLLMDYQHSAGANYTNTNLSVKNANFSFQTTTGMSGYTLKIINNTDNETYYSDTATKIPSIPLITGKNYTVSVMGYNSNGLISDYSQPITFDF